MLIDNEIIADKNIKILGIDPGTKSSPTGIAIIEDISKDVSTSCHVCIFHAELISIPQLPDFINRKIIAQQVAIIAEYYKADIIICEEPFLQGKANKTMLKFLGVLEASLTQDIEYIAPKSVKKKFGSGKLEKEELANKLQKYIDKRLIKNLTRKNKYDILDAIAIALSNFLE